MISESNIQQKEVETRAIDAFSFLEETNEATRTFERERGRSLHVYVLNKMFVEIEMDWQELAVFVLVGEAIDGERPSGYYVDSVGRQVRWHLDAVLRQGDLNEQARSLREVVKRSGLQAMVDQIEAYSAGLRTVLPELPRLIQQMRSG